MSFIPDFLADVLPSARTAIVISADDDTRDVPVTPEGMLEPGDWEEWEEPYVSFVGGDRRVSAVATGEPLAGVFPSATLAKGRTEIYIYLLDQPVTDADVPEDLDIEVPLPVASWTYLPSTDPVIYDLSDLVSTPESAPEAEGAPAEVDGAATPDVASPAPSEVPEKLNDAEIIGDVSADIGDFLARPVSILGGLMFGAGDKRNTMDGNWKTATAPLIRFIEGVDGRFGFSRHPVGKRKEGECVVLGSSLEGARKAKAMDTMYFMGLDIDCGTTLDHVIEKLTEKNILCFIHTSYNHNKRGLQLKRDEVMRKLKIATDPDIESIQTYLREHDKNRYEESFIQQIEIDNAKKQVKDGVVIELSTPPLHKIRLIFPLAEPVKIIDLKGTHQEALDDWENAVTGLACNVLGVHFDTSCTDPSRLFFTPRHPEGAEWYSAIHMGKPLAFDNIPRTKKSTYTQNRTLDPFAMAGGEVDSSRVPDVYLPSGGVLNQWHTRVGKSRFMIADLLETYCADKIRVAGGEAAGHVHTECPFEHEHSSEGGTATMAINCIDNTSEYWTWFCHHDACQNRHKLQFLGEAINRGWFDESLLKDSAFLLPAEDEDQDDPGDAEPDAAPGGGTGDYPGPKTSEDLIEALDADYTEKDVRALCKRFVRRGVDDVEKTKILRLLKKKTGLGARDLSGYWEDEIKARAERERKDDDTATHIPKVNESGFDQLCEYGMNRLRKANDEEARLFHYMERYAIIRDDHQSNAKIKLLEKEGFAHLLNCTARFERMVSDKKSVAVSAPFDVVSHLYAGDPGLFPPLRGLATSPIFSRSGNLILDEGYHYESGLYYRPNHHLVVPKISQTPTEDEVQEAKRLLFEECFADFPLGAKTRSEIIEQTLNPDAEGIPAAANLLALTLVPFCREMIAGPTPGHLLTKPAPGTGASLLTDVLSIIATGETTPAMAMPGNKDEMSKTLTSVLANGQNIVFFDNINHSVDSAELASAMTAKIYSARILGKTQTVDCEVRCVWILTGNNVTLSGELVRRLVMVDLDARLSTPEQRTGFRHDSIEAYVRKNRGVLVWACLTLIQNWIAKGRQPYDGSLLASFEDWSNVMGGILRDAGVNGFMGNRAALKEASDDQEDDDFLRMLHVWWEEAGATPLIIRDPTDKARSISDLINENDINLNMRKERNSDGEEAYTAKAIGRFVARYKGRVFDLDNGVSVSLQIGQRTRTGMYWRLLPAGAEVPDV